MKSFCCNFQAICAGPDAVIWVINVETYEIERTYCFKTHIQRFLKTSETSENLSQNHKLEVIKITLTVRKTLIFFSKKLRYYQI